MLEAEGSTIMQEVLVFGTNDAEEAVSMGNASPD